jgi:GDP-L-fucose synthase
MFQLIMKLNMLITGGTGMVGKSIQKIQENIPFNCYFLGSKDCDLTNYEETKKLFSKIKPDYVIHLAACVGGLYKNMNNKVEMFEKNLLINTHVLKCCYEFNVKKCVCCLSTCIFPDKITYPIDETMLHNGPPHDSNDAYAYAKRMLEKHCEFYNNNYNTNFVCVIPTNIYGTHDNYNLEDSHVIPGLIHKCYLAKLSKEKFIVKGTGKPLRQFIYSNDLAKLILWVASSYKSKETIILSVGEKEEISIKEVATIIAKIYDYEENIEFDEKFSDGQYKKTASNKKLLENIGEFEFTPIQVGIQESIQWFISNYNNCRK